MTIDADRLVAALDTEIEARKAFDAAGAEVRAVVRKRQKPPEDLVQKMRAAAVAYMRAGQDVIKIIDGIE